MRLICRHCGARDRREFTYHGPALLAERPALEAGEGVWDDYLHNRENPAGPSRELWYHDPCGGWSVVDRDTVTHAVFSGTAP